MSHHTLNLVENHSWSSLGQRGKSMFDLRTSQKLEARPIIATSISTSPYSQVTIKRSLSQGMCWIPPNYCMAIPGKYPMHPQIPTKGMPSKPTQWVCPCHQVIPHLTLQVQSTGLRLQKYLSQSLISPEKGRSRTTVARTLFLLTKPTD